MRKKRLIAVEFYAGEGDKVPVLAKAGGGCEDRSGEGGGGEGKKLLKVEEIEGRSGEGGGGEVRSC